MLRQAGAQMLRIRPEPYCRLADEQKLALDRGNRLWVFPKRLQVHATHKLDDHIDAIEDISQGKCGFPKRQGQPHQRLWLRPAPSGLLPGKDPRGYLACQRVGFQ